MGGCCCSYDWRILSGEDDVLGQSISKAVSTSNTPPSNTSSGFSMADPFWWVLTASFLLHGFVQRPNKFSRNVMTELARDGWAGGQRMNFDVYLAT